MVFYVRKLFGILLTPSIVLVISVVVGTSLQFSPRRRRRGRRLLAVCVLALSMISLGLPFDPIRRYSGRESMNVGVGRDISIQDLTEMVCAVVGFEGRVEFDSSKPDGTQRKLLDVTRMNALGWRAQVDLRSGIEDTYA